VSNLENRYRGLLRVLPAWYRAEREEEMVGLFLADRTDELDLEHGWPGWGETGATLALAVRTRLGALGAPARAVAVGDVVRLIALIGVLVQGAYATQGLLSLLPARAPEGGGLVAAGLVTSPVALVPDAALLLASVAVVVGFRGVAKALFGLLSVSWVAHLVEPVGHEPAQHLLPTLLWQVPLWLTTLALIAGFHRDAPAPASRRWRWALAGTVLGTAAAVGANALLHPYATPAPAVIAGVVVAGVAHLLRRGSPVGALGLGWWIVALLPVELLYPAYPGRWIAASMAAVGTALLVVGIRGLRRPPLPVTP
jgi:hypothetical protein